MGVMGDRVAKLEARIAELEKAVAALKPQPGAGTRPTGTAQVKTSDK